MSDVTKIHIDAVSEKRTVAYGDAILSYGITGDSFSIVQQPGFQGVKKASDQVERRGGRFPSVVRMMQAVAV
ncbi:hypothetical protein GDO78_007979 [Eleutherodactylus coqui]|uniref:Uncharacterized protein n=1 Tax=Eleutherodactylus coqui TaxID=57060 RepID=A0A8J6KC18_ELECQ|nr:hypothetical protein GDO78_007979 [Eleutherodactylus coqui]